MKTITQHTAELCEAILDNKIGNSHEVEARVAAIFADGMRHAANHLGGGPPFVIKKRVLLHADSIESNRTVGYTSGD